MDADIFLRRPGSGKQARPPGNREKLSKKNHFLKIPLLFPYIYAKWSYVFQINISTKRQKFLFIRPERNWKDHVGEGGLSR
jgi:hypothetical protein